MWPERVSNLGPLTYESGALPTALRGPATFHEILGISIVKFDIYYMYYPDINCVS